MKRGPAPVVTDHPAKWSAAVLDVIAGMVADEAERREQRLAVLDPFAGVGRQRLAEAIGGSIAKTVDGVELQPEWTDPDTMQGDATELPESWAGTFDVVATSPCYGNRMADHHDAQDRCKTCDGAGSPSTVHGHCTDIDGARWHDVGACSACSPPCCPPCRTCKGQGLSWRNTYAHALRRAGGDLVPGSAAGMQWGIEYRYLHRAAISEMVRVLRPAGLLLVNMSNHVRGREQFVVEWWVQELLGRECGLVEVRRVPTPRLGQGANGGLRVDDEVVIAVRTPADRRLL